RTFFPGTDDAERANLDADRCAGQRVFPQPVPAAGVDEHRPPRPQCRRVGQYLVQVLGNEWWPRPALPLGIDDHDRLAAPFDDDIRPHLDVGPAGDGTVGREEWLDLNGVSAVRI